MRRINPKLQALLRSGEPVALEGGEFYVRFRYEFHQNQVRASIDELNKGLSEVLGRPMQAIVLGEDESPSTANASPAASDEPSPTPNSAPDPQPPTTDAPASSLADHPVVRRAVDKWGGEIENNG